MTAPAPPLVRPELAADAPAVRAVLAAAFGRADEADLVDGLRGDGDLVASLVAVTAAGVPVGYAGFPRLLLDTADAALPAIGLAPLAVAPSRQRQGIGRALVQHGLALLRDRRERLVFVLGEQAYYGRFGFAPAPRLPRPMRGRTLWCCGSAAMRRTPARCVTPALSRACGESARPRRSGRSTRPPNGGGAAR